VERLRSGDLDALADGHGIRVQPPPDPDGVTDEAGAWPWRIRPLRLRLLAVLLAVAVAVGVAMGGRQQVAAGGAAGAAAGQAR
jgi:hypothetical protein